MKTGERIDYLVRRYGEFTLLVAIAAAACALIYLGWDWGMIFGLGLAIAMVMALAFAFGQIGSAYVMGARGLISWLRRTPTMTRQEIWADAKGLIGLIVFIAGFYVLSQLAGWWGSRPQLD